MRAGIGEVVLRYLQRTGRGGAETQLVETGVDDETFVNFLAQNLDLDPLEKQALLEAASLDDAGSPAGRRPRVPPPGASPRPRRPAGPPTSLTGGPPLWQWLSGGATVAPLMELKPPELSIVERLYLPEIFRGVAVTTGHFVRNMALHTLHLFGLARERSAMVTVQYPEQRKVYSEGYRGAHRLTLKPDGSVRCTSCFLCATACPAKCIHIEAGEHPDPTVEKYPVRYEIDTLQCIYCGMCVEACPCDAIRMDTYVHPSIGATAARISSRPSRS